MFISFRTSDGGTIYFSQDGDGVRMEKFDERRGLAFGLTITEEQASELKTFLASKGF